jgi:hypothetical protein
MLIFVFAGISSGGFEPILAEFAPVPNVPSVESPATAEAAPVDPPVGSQSRAERAGNAAGALPTESGGPQGPEPTRFGDWERNGRCIDF